jgi:O-antigen ligase/tetratricopeptide (TPR) repeat protein
MAKPQPRAAPDELARGVPRRIAQAVLTLHLGLVPVVFSLSTHEAFELPKVLLLLTTASVLLGLLVLDASVRIPRAAAVPERLRQLARDPLAVGIALILASAAVSTVFSTSFWTSALGAEDSYAGLPTVTSYAVLFVATRRYVATTPEARRVVAAPVLGAAIASAYALVQVLGVDPIDWVRTAELGEQTRPFGTFGHPNFLAGYLAMVLPLVLYFTARAWMARRKWAAHILGLTAVLFLLLIALSASRGAWLAVMAVLAVLGVVLLKRAPGRALMGLAAGLAMTLLALVALPELAPQSAGLVEGLLHRIAHIADSPSRLHIWAAAARIFQGHPVVGCGLDNFQLAFQRQRTIEYWLVEWGATPQKAHNGLLQLLATQGLLGLAALGVCAFALVRAARHSWTNAGPARRSLLSAAAAGLLAYLVQVTFSFTVAAVGSLLAVYAAVLSAPPPPGEGEHAPEAPRPWSLASLLAATVVVAMTIVVVNLPPSANVVLPLVLIGVALAVAVALVRVELAPGPLELPKGIEGSSGRARGPSIERSALAGILFVALLFVGVVQPFRASVAFREGRLAREPSEALRLLERATQLGPLRVQYWLELARARLQAAGLARSRSERGNLLREARAAAERARTLAPTSANARAGLGTILAAQAQTTGSSDAVAAAMESFDAAIDRDPVNPYLHVKAAEASRLLGRPERAREHLDRALELLPDFGPALSERALLARDEGDLAEAITWLERSVAGLHRDAGSLVNALANLASAYYTAGRLAEALPVAQSAVERDPDPDLRYNLGRILEGLGRTAEAEREYRRVLAARPGHGPATLALARLLGPEKTQPRVP